MCAENAVCTSTTPCDDHTDAANHTVIAQQLGAAKTGFFAQILDDNGLA